MSLKAKNGTRGLLESLLYWALWALFLLCLCLPLVAQNCQTSSDLDDAGRSAITSAAQRFFEMAAKDDVTSMQQKAIAGLASNFSPISGTIKDHESELSGAQATVNSLFLLEATGAAAQSNAEFYCGVFGKNGQTSNSAIFNLSNLPAGKYAVVVFNTSSPKGNTHFSLILQQEGGEWKLGGLYIKPAQIGGHDGDWFLTRARDYKGKGQMHNAWLYYVQAFDMISPLSFMSTQNTDKLYEEFHSARPGDVPGNGQTSDLQAGASVYKLTALSPVLVGNDLDLLVKYQVPDASNANQAYQSNMAVIKALVAKYPELRDAFAGIEARAVDPNGRDYGTLLGMKDIK